MTCVPNTHRGWSIEQSPIDTWLATHPDYDASYEGEEDGWVSNGKSVDALTYDALIEEIDNWIAENEPAFSLEEHIA